MEAARNNRRYIPPAREVLQTLYGPTDPPSRPADAEDETTFPIIRIGDTIEMKFTPSTPFDKLCHGYELEPKGQVALGFGSDNADGVRSLEFEVLHHAGEDGLACLRCQQELPKCCCGYANDLLEINRDWKAKKDPTRRLGLRAFDDGVVGVSKIVLTLCSLLRLISSPLLPGCSPNSSNTTPTNSRRTRCKFARQAKHLEFSSQATFAKGCESRNDSIDRAIDQVVRSERCSLRSSNVCSFDRQERWFQRQEMILMLLFILQFQIVPLTSFEPMCSHFTCTCYN